MSTTELTVPGSGGIADIRVFHTDLALVTQAISENMGPSGITEFDLQRITVPSGGGTFWKIPTLEGPKAEPLLRGVIVFQRDIRAYWKVPLEKSGGGTPPDCSSLDSITGNGKPGGLCHNCPLAQFGSDDDKRGQACKQAKQLFILRGENLLPEVVSVPATSLKNAKQYLLQLSNAGIPYWAVLTELTLTEAKNAGGLTYSRINFKFAGKLDAKTQVAAQKYGEMLRPMLVKTIIDATDVGAPGKPSDAI